MKYRQTNLHVTNSLPCLSGDSNLNSTTKCYTNYITKMLQFLPVVERAVSLCGIFSLLSSGSIHSVLPLFPSFFPLRERTRRCPRAMVIPGGDNCARHKPEQRHGDVECGHGSCDQASSKSAVCSVSWSVTPSAMTLCILHYVELTVFSSWRILVCSVIL